MDRMAFHNEGGVFGGFFSQDTMRSRAYKYSNIHANLDRCNGGSHNLLIVKRRNSRRWVREMMYEKMIKRTWGNVITGLFSY